MKVRGTAARPRLAVFRSNIHIYAQLIDDVTATTLAASSDLVIKAEKKGDKKMLARVADAYAVGFDLAKRGKAGGIDQATFDRGGYLYTGRVKSLAEGARAGGLEF